MSVKTSRRFIPTWAHPNLLKKPGLLRVYMAFNTVNFKGLFFAAST
nr:MAG TPA: hypothetical protein [Caudoviricetes sp.]